MNKRQEPFKLHAIQKTGNWVIFSNSNNWFDIDLSSSIYEDTLNFNDLP